MPTIRISSTLAGVFESTVEIEETKVSRSSRARQAAFLNNTVEIGEINLNLQHATHLRRPEDWERIDKISNHTPVVFYFWQRSSAPCRFVGPILDHHPAVVDGSVMLVAYEANDPKQLKVLRKQGAVIPHVAAMYRTEINRGFQVNGGKDDDQVLIEMHLELMPPGDFPDRLRSHMTVNDSRGKENPNWSSVEGYFHLLDGEGRAGLLNVVEFARYLALGDAYLNALHFNFREEQATGGDSTSGSVEVAGADPLDQLKKVGELHSTGVLTDEEFAAKKAELLRKL